MVYMQIELWYNRTILDWIEMKIMNRKELQEWLEQFPEETEIEVMIQEESRYQYESYGASCSEKFTGKSDEQFEYSNFVDNKFVKEDSPLFGKKILTLGSSC